MAYSDTLNLVTGDTLPELTFTLRDSNAAASGQTLDPNNSATWAPIDVRRQRKATTKRAWQHNRQKYPNLHSDQRYWWDGGYGLSNGYVRYCRYV